MKKVLKRFIYNLNYKWLMKDIILMESSPDFTDNTQLVYEELIRRGVNKKVRIIWFTSENYDNRKMPENVLCLHTESHRIRVKYLRYFAKYIIDCNRYIEKKNKNQFRIHLTHGAPSKLVPEYHRSCGPVDYLVQISDFSRSYICETYNIMADQLVLLGFPRNDDLVHENKMAKKFLRGMGTKKAIVWLPTYRNHRKAKKKDWAHTGIDFPFGIPCVNDEKELKALDECARKKNVTIVVKLHPAEDTSRIANMKLDNVIFITDKMLEEHGLRLYQLLSASDAMITDYSSVYYDYLLCDKPIGIAAPDREEYNKRVGLFFDDFEGNIVGEYLDDVEDVKEFIREVAANEDKVRKVRGEKTKVYHKYLDGNSSRRVVDLFLDKTGLGT